MTYNHAKGHSVGFTNQGRLLNDEVLVQSNVEQFFFLNIIYNTINL